MIIIIFFHSILVEKIIILYPTGREGTNKTKATSICRYVVLSLWLSSHSGPLVCTWTKIQMKTQIQMNSTGIFYYVSTLLFTLWSRVILVNPVFAVQIYFSFLRLNVFVRESVLIQAAKWSFRLKLIPCSTESLLIFVSPWLSIWLSIWIEW